MLKKNAIGYALAGAALLALTCCNSDFQSGESVSSSAVVKEFTLSANDAVAANLDSVYFSIDLTKQRIFNADSLPYGTRTNKLVPIISTLDGASVAELTVRRDGLADTVFDYLKNPGDTIDFTYPVMLRLVSNDGSVTRNYTIDVNVHQIKPDSLFWSRTERRNLPSSFQVPNEQWTAATASRLYCLTRYQSDYCMACCENPGEDSWQYATPAFGFTPKMDSFRATDDALYILSDAGELYTSADGASWTDCGITADYLYGGYTNLLMANRIEADGCHLFTYPATTDRLMPADFPVSGTSLPINYAYDMSVTPMVLLTGGRLANGSLTGHSWGFDGTEWAKISAKPIATPVEYPVVVPYFIYKSKTNFWIASRYSALLAFCGTITNGMTTKEVYLSLDFGLTWNRADDLMQLPDYFPTMTRAQGFVYNQTIESRTGSLWTGFAAPLLPVNAVVELPELGATAPVTEWECPYIYVFGGIGGSGSLYNTVWRGAINRFTFKPLY